MAQITYTYRMKLVIRHADYPTVGVWYCGIHVQLCRPAHTVDATSDGCDSCVLCQMDREMGWVGEGKESSLNETCSGVQEAIYSRAHNSFLLVLASLAHSLIPNPESLIANFSNQMQPVKTEWRWVFSIYLFVFVVCLFTDWNQKIQMYDRRPACLQRSYINSSLFV